VGARVGGGIRASFHPRRGAERLELRTQRRIAATTSEIEPAIATLMVVSSTVQSCVERLAIIAPRLGRYVMLRR
jgi:hypothetical protein